MPIRKKDDDYSTKQLFVLENSELLTAGKWDTLGDDYYLARNEKPQDYVKARFCYEQALTLDATSTMACYNLGWVYEFGKGIEKNINKAKGHYKKGADLGGTLCAERLFILDNSNLTTAEEWDALGEKYFFGRNKKPVDYTKARICYERSLEYETKLSNAYYSLGAIYKDGKEIEQDLGKACEYYHQAALLGHEESKKNLIRVIIDKKDIKKAKKYFDFLASEIPYRLGILFKEANELQLALKAFHSSVLRNTKQAFIAVIDIYKALTKEQFYSKEEYNNPGLHQELAYYFLGRFFQLNVKNSDLAIACYLKFRGAGTRKISTNKNNFIFSNLGKLYFDKAVKSATHITKAIEYNALAAKENSVAAYDRLCDLAPIIKNRTNQADLDYEIAIIGRKFLNGDKKFTQLAKAKQKIDPTNVKNLLQSAMQTWLELSQTELTFNTTTAFANKISSYEKAIIYLNKAKAANSEPAKQKLKLLTNQFITALLYQALRKTNGTWNLKAAGCKPYLNLLKKIDTKYEKWTVAQFRKHIAQEEKAQHTYFGTEVSDNSDSDEEKSFQKCSAPVQQAALLHTQGLFHKANLNQAKTILTNVTEKTKTYEKSKPVLKPNETIGKNPNANEKITTDLAELNHWRRQGKLEEGLKLTARTQFAIAQFRGIHYKLTDWSQPQRQAHRTMLEVGAPLFCASAYNEAKYDYTTNCLEDEDSKNKLLSHAEIVKERLLALRNSGPHFKKSNSRKDSPHYKFDSVADRLQNDYTKDYDKFSAILKAGEVECKQNGTVKLNLLNKANPFISMGDVPLHALKYAYGIKPYEGHEHERLHPRWSKDHSGVIGQAERPYSGKVYVTLHTIAEYKQDNPVHVTSHNHLGKLAINDNAKGFQIINERETTYPAYIPEGRVAMTHIAKYPSFSGPYKTIYAMKYGIDKEFYTAFQAALKEFPPGSEGIEVCRILLGEYLCHYHQFRLLEQTQLEAAKRNLVLVYVDERGDLSLNLPPLIAAAAKSDKQGKANLEYVRQKRKSKPAQQPPPAKVDDKDESDDESYDEQDQARPTQKLRHR